MNCYIQTARNILCIIRTPLSPKNDIALQLNCKYDNGFLMTSTNVFAISLLIYRHYVNGNFFWLHLLKHIVV